MAGKKQNENEYLPQFKHALLNIHQLLCYFIGSKKIAKMASEKGFLFLHLMQRMHEKEEVLQLLINIATHIRIGTDYQKFHSPEYRDLSTGEVGQLLELKKQKPLTLLESCNKIIHATKFPFKTGRTRKSQYKNSSGDCVKFPYLKPFIYLQGTRWNKARSKDIPWKATINIEAFTKHAAVACLGYMGQFRQKD